VIAICRPIVSLLPWKALGSTEFTLERTQVVPVDVEDAFGFFSDPRNLEAITPSWLRFRIVESPETLARGSEIGYRLHLFGVPIRWRAVIADWKPPRSFRDVQAAGPYPLWEHTHRFSPAGGGTEIFDHVRYRVPGGPLTPLVHRLVSRWLDEIFDFRRDRLAEILSAR
jgi:ligand-binding SRPBCC domain-containing protein